MYYYSTRTICNVLQYDNVPNMSIVTVLKSTRLVAWVCTFIGASRIYYNPLPPPNIATLGGGGGWVQLTPSQPTADPHRQIYFRADAVGALCLCKPIFGAKKMSLLAVSWIGAKWRGFF